MLGHPNVLREVVGIVYKAAKALDDVQRQGIIHRNIKPGNIHLTGERDIKLADFTVAMINRADIKATQLTDVLRSPLYMSPEQINEQTLDTTTDILSLGAVMYQLLTGVQPFEQTCR